MRLRPRSVTLLAALVAAALTDLVVMVPGLHYAYRSVPLHAMLETTATIIALLTTVLPIPASGRQRGRCWKR